uniref:Small subunit ribosomal protein S13 n=1 Tax=Tetraselmis sp. GSL018 TaxID=582737 RepID=A0A061SCD0_9CHLO|eukprot:CAMPEP_0177594394 /NCGR_PEP_ID=MMETSP0419_2-20121207/9757_1 /TAXON_ID=582737 /ORGANISM="Tetraselmis sp., Strain GSL018" /LENGTH=160 /DNA_ID=CAMNT_0019085699 /DNA_START=76 /DNA_END=558 /DNA_ORIENTATION=-
MSMAITSQLAGLTIGGGKSQKLQVFEGLRSQGSSNISQRASSISQARRTPLRIQAARIANVEVPNKKRIETSLTYIFGIGPTTAKVILESTNIENKRTYELTEDELTTLRAEVDKYTVEGDLRRFDALNIKRLKEIQCYRGKRHQAVRKRLCIFLSKTSS